MEQGETHKHHMQPGRRQGTTLTAKRTRRNGTASQQPNKAGIYIVDGPAKPDIAGNVARSVRPAVLFAMVPWCSKSVCCAVLDVLDLAAWCPASSSCSSFMWRSVRGHCRHLKTLMGFHVVDRHRCFFQNSRGSFTHSDEDDGDGDGDNFSNITYHSFS